MTRILDLDEVLRIAERVNGTRHCVRDAGLLASACERPRITVFGQDAYPGLHEKAAALLHAVARNHALVDGNKRTAWLAARTLLAFNGIALRDLPADDVVPFVEAVARGELDVQQITKTLHTWMPR